MITTIIIGNRIADARKKMNISQAQLAERLFISSQAVGKWERGESMPDIITINRLAEILGVDLNYFSENFKSVNSEIAQLESSAMQSPELLVATQDPSDILPAGSHGKVAKNLSWDMSRGNWVDADFSGLKNLNEKFGSSNMQNCKFIGSDLSGLLLKNNNVESCDFSGSDISNSRFQSSNLGKNIFKDCKLEETEFSRSNLESCDFSGANLTGTKFFESSIYGCDLNGANFTGVVIKSGGLTGDKAKPGEFEKNLITGAVWDHTSFIDTQIADLILDGTLTDCYFDNCAFTRVTIQNATLLNTFFKNNKKLKRIRFIDCKADRMTLEFLKQGKADLTGITLLTPAEENE